MFDNLILLLFVSVILLILAMACKPTRKALGLVLCVIGLIECFTCIGFIIGIVTIFVGGLLLFS